MIIIPELETIVLCPPRTGSTSLKYAIADRYKKSFLLYRHMEADGVPHGYDRWTKVGLVREPIDRLWSLYMYCKYTLEDKDSYTPGWFDDVRIPPEIDFSEWILHNKAIFTQAHSVDKIFAGYTVLHAFPETCKSQYHTLRPDLGTQVLTFDNRDSLFELLDVQPEHLNTSLANMTQHATLTPEAMAHIEKYFAWDLNVFKSDLNYKHISERGYERTR